ncbi:MAG: hypothetical protein NTY03_16955 [Candidatus Bathyarchaeota archaeon]|nr:hypothetical protein [Candidatus Bathyarchaeota archaeon]
MSIYERVERMQEKDPEKIMGGEFTLNPKSCLNIPSCAYSPKESKVRIMKSADDE